MLQTFKVQNVKCSGCAATLKSKLHEKFGEIEVNLEVEPREITLDIKEDQTETLKNALRGLGYPLVDEKLNFFENNTAKAKSFVSCAVGKFEVAQG